jgi:hypothetical protein
MLIKLLIGVAFGAFLAILIFYLAKWLSSFYTWRGGRK